MTSTQKPVDGDDSSHGVSLIEAPPPTTLGMLMRIGPGLILVGSIVGSGELIATPAVGARAGFILLWLILVGTVIKVFAQVEFGRFSICNGETAMTGMNDVPGPKLFGANWLSWYWLIMFLSSLGQLGGIVGGVGQAMAISWPLTQGGAAYNDAVNQRTRDNMTLHVLRYEVKQAGEREDQSEKRKKITELENSVAALNFQITGVTSSEFKDWDANGDGKVDAAEREKPLGAAFDKKRTQTNGDERLTVEEKKDRIEELDTQQHSVQLAITEAVKVLDTDGDGTLSQAEVQSQKPPLNVGNVDDRYWAVIITVITAVLLVIGHYGFIETASTIMVASFTVMTVGNLIMMQTKEGWAIGWSDIAQGLSLQLPKQDLLSSLSTALGAFGIIGVGANELIQYPSWCLEKGYARFTGPKDSSPEWATRANGWLNVMQWDVWLSLVVYTFATIAFYLIGAAVLGRLHLIPNGTDMMRTLSTMYEPVFGDWTRVLFLVGAFAVLYSTFFAATAGHARVCSDAVHLFGKLEKTDESHVMWVRIFSAGLPFLCMASYLIYPEPATLVLISGAMQGIMLPMLAVAALYFRYCRCDERVAPNGVWDFFLWITTVGLVVSGTITVVLKFLG